jgi:rRNA processing protein Krr1/Pno1
MLPFVAAGAGAGVVSYLVGLPLGYAVFLAVAIVVVAIGVTSALTVKVPPVEPKPRKPKVDKSRRNSTPSSTTPEDTSTSDEKSEDNKTEAKVSKRDKERAKKAAKKEAEEKQKQAEAERVAAEEKKKAAEAKAAAAAQKAAEEAAEKERIAALEAGGEEGDDAPAKKNKKKKKKKTDEKKSADSAAAAKPIETKNNASVPKKTETVPKKSEEIAPTKKTEATTSKKTDAAAPKNTEAPKPEPAVVERKLEEKETKIAEENWETKTTKNKRRGAEAAAAAAADMTTSLASTEHKTEIYIDPKACGVVIGKAGATLKIITDATQTSIDFKKEEGKVTVSGPNRENVDKAIEAINQLATKGYSVLTHGRRDEGSIVVPSNKRFAVIGPAGQTVRLIQDKFKVKVNLPDRTTNDSTVTVLGDNADVQEALKCIADLIDKGYSEITHPGYVSETIEVPTNQLGSIIGTAGAIVREIQESTGTKINIEGTSVTVVGQQSQVTEAKNKIVQLLTPVEPLPADPEWSQEASSRYVDLW